MEETLYDFWLMNIEGIGPRTVNKLIEYAGSAKEVWHLNDSQLASLKLDKTKREAIVRSRNEENILKSYKCLSEKGVTFISQNSSLFPEKLRNIHQPPKALYLRGRLPDPQKLSIAIVGARSCSEYGRYVARKISAHLAMQGFQVISGLAQGIDVISQKAALESHGYSLGVLGCGVDICYPAENRETYNRLVSNGGIISEYAPGTPPKAAFFPMRNRIISAMSDIVVVIEAREKSGSLITADLALEQGKEIYALPGRVTDSLSHGCNRLIRQGAGIILSPEEFIGDLAVNYSVHKDILSPTDDNYEPGNLFANKTGLSRSERILLDMIDFNPVSISQLQAQSSLPFPELLDSLMTLTVKGLVSQNGSYYSLNS